MTKPKPWTHGEDPVDIQQAIEGADEKTRNMVYESEASRKYVVGMWTHVARYILDLTSEIHALKQKYEPSSINADSGSGNAAPSPSSAASDSKKRKADSTNMFEQAPKKTKSRFGSNRLFRVKDVSYIMPMRKKNNFMLIGDSLDEPRRVIVQMQDGKGEVVGDPWGGDNIDHIISVPAPEKSQATTYFLLLPKIEIPTEPIVFSVSDTEAKECTVFGDDEATKGQTYPKVIHKVFDDLLKTMGKKVITPSSDEFVSSITQAHRKNEKAYHVKAYQGSKEGYLFFLSPGILFGFKKPISWMPFEDIVSVSYTSVLQRTFNLNVTTQVGDVEFAMLDQADFEGIDKYIKGHKLHDASLAESRKAKVYNVNKQANGQSKDKNGDGKAAGAEDEEEESALAKAERELQDAEDAEEEDFEVGSGGESDGSGSDSEDGEGDEEMAEDGEGGADDADEEDDNGAEEEDDEAEDQQQTNKKSNDAPRTRSRNPDVEVPADDEELLL